MGALHATMNISLDACCEHTQVLADDEFHDRMSDLFSQATALLFGRNTYELLRSYWPQVASTAAGTPAEVRLARVLNEKPKYVVSSVELGADWNARRIDAEPDGLRALKQGITGTLLLVASPTLARALLDLDLIDEYHVAISPIVAGRGPTFLAGLQRDLGGALVGVDRLRSGVLINRYRFGGTVQ
jgi:dihydrofolate reductase